MEMNKYEIKQIANTTDYALVVYLDAQDSEFAEELGTDSSSQNTFMILCKNIVKKHYPSLKITAVQVVVSGLLVTTIPFAATSASAQTKTEQESQLHSTYYQVASGDSLWTISRAFNITVDSIKRANQLTTDVLQQSQRLIIPKAFHTVSAGDTLSLLARDYGTTVTAIQVANQLTSDSIRIGQTVVIPLTLGEAKPAATDASQQTVPTTYTVTSGDSLSVIAKRYGVTVESLREANQLSSDLLRVGQSLMIPAKEPTFTIQPIDQVYTVAAGDSLSVIAAKFQIPTDALRSANHLTTDVLQIGQRLVIPNPKTLPGTTPDPIAQYSTHTVTFGESLWGIASQYRVTVDLLRSANNLKTDLLQIGQTLVVPTSSSGDQPKPTTSDPSSYTVISGDSLSVIAAKFKVSTDALRAANNLKSDVLQIGQVLVIPEKLETNESPQPEKRTTFTYTVAYGDNLSVIAHRYQVTVDSIRTANNLKSDVLQVGQRLMVPDAVHAPAQTSTNSLSYITHTVRSGDTIWDLSVRYGIPQSELLQANHLTMRSMLSVGQQLTVPVHQIGMKTTVSPQHGEVLDWWTEAQYVFPIGKVAKVTDLATGKSFNIKRTIGANHADCETVTVTDSNTAKSIWGGFSWTPRAVLVEVDGRKLAASMSFMPHDVQYIQNNGITGHFDVYFANSTRHVDGKSDPSHQLQVERAAGVR